MRILSETSGSTSFIKYDLKNGQPHVTGAAGQKTVYADNAWECYYKASAASNGGTQKTTNFASQDVWQDAGESVKYMVKTSERGGGAFVEYSVTFRNDSTGTRYVGLSYGSDVMIHNNDRAPLTVTSSGIKMEEASGDSCQFNINTTTATAGISVSADGYWIGVYSGRQHWQSTVAGDGNKQINGNGEAYVTGIDSGLTFSWVPQNHPLAPGESVTFTCQFGIGKMSEPPRIVPHYESGSGRSTNVTLNDSKLDISAWVAGESAYPLRLYYILDEGLPTQQSEASLGGKVSAQGVVSAATFRGYSEAQKTAYFRTGTENHFVNITGMVEKPRDWVAGEYHSITLYGLSDAGLMTDSVRFPLYVDENEKGEEVFVDATDAIVNFNRGTGSGTAPASQTAHLKEPIVLSKGDGMTPPSGQKFVGWRYVRDDGKATIYPAENYFYVEKNPTTLTARYIPTSQTMYLVETYTQNAAGDYVQGASRSDKVALDPVVSETGRYGYSSKPRRLPATPSAWKDTEGKVYTFLEWRLVENGEITETVVSKDTILPNYENVTVKAVWTESYSVSRSSQGSVWRHVTITDLLQLELSEVYDATTHSLTLNLADSVRTGRTYWLRYSTKLSAEHLGDAASVEVINKALASGVDIEGHEIVAEASDMIRYEKPAEPEKPGNETQDPQKPEDNGSGGIKTGDTANVTPYLLGLLAAVILLAVIVLLRVQKGKKK